MIISKLTGLGSKLAKNYRETKAELKGVAVSRARMVKNAKDIPEVFGSLASGPAKPIPGANVRMMNGQPMTFFTDGSLRNGYGNKPPISGRQFRKLRKKVRRDRKAAAAVQDAKKAEVEKTYLKPAVDHLVDQGRVL